MHERQPLENSLDALATPLVGPFGRLQRRIGRNRDKGVEFGVTRLDAVQQRRHELNRREFTVFEALRQLRQAPHVQVAATHSMTFGTR